MITTPSFVLFAAAAFSMTEPAPLAPPAPIKTLIITGVSNHNWRFTSQLHKDTLEATGRFNVDICENPEIWLADAEAITPYTLFVICYNDLDSPRRWPAKAEQNFVAAVRSGAGVMALHEANNAFRGSSEKGIASWAEYEEMLGLMWRDGAGHGNFHAFDVAATEPDHPVFKGLPPIKAHADELYHGLSNPRSSKYRLLAQAFDKKEIGGTDKNEPMVITNQFGKGRILATPLGHVWNNSDDSKVSVIDPQFKALIARAGEWAATGEVTLPAQWKDVRTHNQLTPKQNGDGWILLFDGKVAKFRGFKQPAMPDKGWKVANGELVHVAGEGGGDIVTENQYGDFEFSCDWTVAKGGNSGIMFHCTEDHTYPWETGPEMQILDDANHQDGKKPKTRAGTLYDLVPCAFDMCRPAGEWNTATLRVQGSHIQHWLNGQNIVDIDTTSPAWAEAYKASKWPGMKDYNTRLTGHIALQDHGDEVRFRNIMVRTLK